jgi:YbbR domain-containing protein
MQFLTRNLGWKLLSLLVAFFFWLNIAREPDLATIISVPVEYNNFPGGLEISSKIVESIYVEARGAAGQLRNLKDSRIAAVVDFSTVDAPGERTFTLTAKQLNLPRGINLIRTIPAQLRFTFEKQLTREIAVNVKFSGTLPQGLSVAQVDVEPRELSITGPESRVRESKDLVSDPFDLTAVTADTQQILGVYEAEPEVRILDAPQVTVKIHIQRKP